MAWCLVYLMKPILSAMKRILLIAIFGFSTIAFLGFETSAQVIVKVKPVPPKVKMLSPKKPGSEYVLIPGHWVWHRPTKMYVWVGPNWTPRKDSKVWVPGHWKQFPKGWKWIPGHWEKKFKKRYFLK